MFYISTRNNKICKTPAEAVLEGISKDGGLYMPKSFEGCIFPMEGLEKMSKKKKLLLCILKFMLKNYLSLTFNMPGDKFKLKFYS